MCHSTQKEGSDLTRGTCVNKYNQKLFDSISELAWYKGIIGKVRNHQFHIESAAMWNQVGLQILLVRVSVLLNVTLALF
jgi:hypothetical protein